MANQGRPSGPRRGDDAGRSGDRRSGGPSQGRGRGQGDSRGAQGGQGRRGGRGDDAGSRGRGDAPYSRPRRDDGRDDRPRSEDQARYDGPPLDESISGKELDRNVAQQLRGLPEKLAARVARHLVAAGLLMDEDPKTAYQHTLAARARAARIAVVREACGEAAYAAGEFADALSELRAAKLTRNPAVADMPADLKAEVTIVEAGARRDLGEIDAALRTLENAPLRSQSRADWVVRLRYAYADTLLAAGRTEDAVEWFHRTIAIDGEEITDAEERVAELERGPRD